MASLNQLREDGQWDKVFGHVLRPERDPKKQTKDEFKETWRLRLLNHLTGRRCLLLEAAAPAHAEGTLSAVSQRLTKYPGMKRLGSLLEKAGPAYEARRKLISVLADKAVGELQIATAVRHVVDATERGWQYSPDGSVDRLARERIPYGEAIPSGHAREPSFMNLLPGESWRTIFRHQASQLGWMHPGLLLAGETLAAIVGDHRTPDAVAETWIMFAWNDPGRPQGILARLKMERLPNGCGVLLPDAWSAGYLQMDADFSRGLQRAWLAVQQRFRTPCEFDWRWSLDLQHATRRLPGAPVVVPLTGPSAEAAFACALRAVDGRDTKLPRTGEVLDPHVAITARLDQDLGRNPRLQPVTDVGIKTLNGRFVERRMQAVVLAKGHDDADLPPTDERLRFEKIATCDEAYHQLTRWPKITRAVKRSIHAAATKLRHKLCGAELADWRESGRRYVPSPLAQVLPVLHGADINPEQPREPRPLSVRELKAFSHGRWRSSPPDDGEIPRERRRAPRIRLFADSGLGKSIQLLICEQKIAATSDESIPIRLGKTDKDSLNLSAIRWTDDPDAVLRNLLRKCVEDHLPEEDRLVAEDWFRDQVRRGRVVFLLDALDQSKGDLEGLGSFLNCALLDSCPVILAGRPETRFGKSEAFEGLSDDAWSTLRVLPFGRRQQDRFFGTRLSPDLIPEDDEPESWKSNYAEELRRHQWKDLLGVPLLLRFLKDLALGGDGVSGKRLQDLTNRYVIYQAAIEQLVAKGLSTVPGSPGLLRLQVQRLLPRIAFEAARRHNFSGVVEGDSFSAVFDQVEKLYEQLVQVDLVTEHCVLDDFGKAGLEFRHRSFLEYFAGCRLAELFADPATRGEAVAVLQNVQSVQEDTGNVRGDILNADGETIRDLPADWHWTLRFALCHAATLGVHDALAAQLIRLGNPWIVYDALDRDGLAFDPDLAQVCRWLVHRDYGHRDYRDAWQAEESAPVASWGAVCRRREFGPAGTASTAGWLEELLLNRSTRDGAYLQPLYELLETTIAEADGNAALGDVASACRTALEKYLQESAARRRIAPGILPVYESRFIPLPPGDFDPARFHKEHRLRQAGVTGPVSIPAGLKLSDFPVTNAELEEWCPTHRRWRDTRSHADDQPAVYVSWYMSVEFGRWLTGERTDGTYELPTEWVWESACRWKTEKEYWWGDETRNAFCCYRQCYNLTSTSGTRHREDTIQAQNAAGVHHPSREWALSQGLAGSPGLLDVHGNVREWTESVPKRVYPGQVNQGGSWYDNEDTCRSEVRAVNESGYRCDHIGLRLCWRSRFVSPESSSS